MRLSRAAITLIAAGIAGSSAIAQESGDQDVIDIRETTCRMLLTFDGQEEEQAMIFFHGYMSGAEGNPVVDIAAFSEASAAITETCIDNPSMKLLDAFKAHR